MFTETPFDTSFHRMEGPRQITTLADASPYAPGSPMLRALMENRSFYTCYESLQLAHGSGPDRPIVFDANPGERVRDVEFSPNELGFLVTRGAADARVILNQNWAPGWTSTAGEIVAPRPTELSSVTMPPEQNGRYVFTFRPPQLIAGLVIFDATLIVTLVLWRRRSKPIFSAPA